MTDWVRVKDANTGHEFTTRVPEKGLAAHLTIVGKPALGLSGHPLPGKPLRHARAPEPAPSAREAPNPGNDPRKPRFGEKPTKPEEATK